MVDQKLFHAAQGPEDQPFLVGGRCTVCGYTSFPLKQVCLRCRRDDTMEEKRLGPRGVLETFAVMQTGTPDFSPPYVIGYVRTEQGALVYSLITGCPARDDALEIGQEMELVIDKIRTDENGRELTGWKFRPVQESR